MNKRIYGQVLDFKDFKGDSESPYEMIVTIRPATSDVDRYNEITDQDAFMKAMPEFMKNPVSMYNHEHNIGKILAYDKDKKSVIVDIGLAKTDKAREVAELVRIGAVSRSSFMFGKANYKNEEGRDDVRRLVDFEIYEMGLVDIPANPNAGIINFKNYKDNEFIVINENEDNSNNLLKGKKTMDLDKKKLLDDMRAIVDPMQLEVDGLRSDWVTMKENAESATKLMKQVEEKQQQLVDGRINKEEFETFAGKIGTDILDIQKDLKRFEQAGKIQANRLPYSDWKALSSDIKVVFDENGQALSAKHQKAYHFLHTPFDFDTDEGKRLRDLRDLNDTIIIAHAYFKKMGTGNYRMENLKCFQLFEKLLKDFDPELQKAMYSTGTGVGDEWVPTNFSAQLHEAYELEMNLETHIPRWEMPSNSAYYPISGARPRMYRVGEAAVNNPTQMVKSNHTTSNTLFTTETFGVAVMSSPEFIEDSIIAAAPALRKSISKAMSEGNESRYLNADDSTAGTHMDTAADWATDTTYPEAYEKGFRKFAIAGSRNISAQSASAGVGDGTTAFVAEDVRSLRGDLPSGMGHKAKDLVYVTSINVWLNMLSFNQYSQIGTYGANASWLTGDLPAFDGSPLVVTSELSETMASTGLKTGSDTTKGLVCYNKTDFKVGYKRNVTLEFDKDILTQQYAFVATQRNSFKSMSASTYEAVAYLINIP